VLVPPRPLPVIADNASTRSMLAMIGAGVILTDPIFQGLAISLLFGRASSTLLTVLMIPAILRSRPSPMVPASGPIYRRRVVEVGSIPARATDHASLDRDQVSTCATGLE
jgi:hypothetical protein